MDCSMPGLPVYHQLPELAVTHVHRVGDAIQLSHPLLFPSPLTFNLDSILGSRDMLPTNVHLVSAIVFPVVMYGCESWTTEKAEH